MTLFSIAQNLIKNRFKIENVILAVKPFDDFINIVLFFLSVTFSMLFINTRILIKN